MITERLLRAALADAVRVGSLAVTFASGRTTRFGDGSGEDLAIRFTDAAAERAMLLDPDLRFGELYMDERLVLERGSIFALLRLFYANAEDRPQPLLARIVDATRFRLRRLARTNLPGRSRANVAHHYDLDTRLFRLFLDEDMQYSCAWFPTDDATLEEAQEAKKRRIAAKLALLPGQTVLDIGCGWGGLALHLATRPEAPLVDGVTLSTEQLGTAQRRAVQAGLSSRVRVRLEDYRAVQGPYDRIVSVGMFEHVGAAFYPTFFRHVARLLKPDGAMLLHTIGSSEAPGFVTPWLNKYIFPGGDIPSLSEIVPAIERAGLVVTDVEVLRLHYALTLHAWSQRFQARRSEAAAVYDERLCRMWEFYLAAAECAFRHENLVVFQIQLARRADTLPIRRGYMERDTAPADPDPVPA
jgi:cyclopropane-fatty-acyl-phospholipid synthase